MNHPENFDRLCTITLTQLCYYKLGPHAFTLQAQVIAYGSDLANSFDLEESDHD